LPKRKTETPAAPLEFLRAICLALPEAAEQQTWDHPTFRVRKKIFAMYVPLDGVPAFWSKAPPGVQAILTNAAPDRFFAPPYVGPKGWIGVRLDAATDWTEITQLVARSWRMTAPRKLVAARAAG
jgi:hypothetical protein